MCLYFYRHIQTYAHTYLIICASPNPWHQSDKSVDFFIPFKPPIHDFPLPHALLLWALGVPVRSLCLERPPPMSFVYLLFSLHSHVTFSSVLPLTLVPFEALNTFLSYHSGTQPVRKRIIFLRVIFFIDVCISRLT